MHRWETGYTEEQIRRWEVEDQGTETWHRAEEHKTDVYPQKLNIAQ